MDLDCEWIVRYVKLHNGNLHILNAECLCTCRCWTFSHHHCEFISRAPIGVILIHFSFVLFPSLYYIHNFYFSLVRRSSERTTWSTCNCCWQSVIHFIHCVLLWALHIVAHLSYKMFSFVCAKKFKFHSKHRRRSRFQFSRVEIRTLLRKMGENTTETRSDFYHRLITLLNRSESIIPKGIRKILYCSSSGNM